MKKKRRGLTKSERRKKKKKQLINKKLIKKYYWLIPRNVWSGKILKDYDYTWIDWGWSKGWDKAFGQMYLKELGDEIDRIGQKNFMILQQKEKYGCYDEKTEVLTKEGWKHFKDLSYEDEIATLNPKTNYLEYQLPIEIISEHYNGKMYRLENRGVSLCVTPNHNLYVAKGSYFIGAKNNFKRCYNFELCNPQKYFRSDKRFLKTCKWMGKLNGDIYKIKGIEYSSPRKLDDESSSLRHYIKGDLSFNLIPWLKFLGFYIAEGYVSNKKTAKRYDDIGVAFNPHTEVDLVKKLINDIGFEPTINLERVSARFCDLTLANLLNNNCGHGATNKKVPRFIKELPHSYIKIFLEYLFIGDGHKTSTSNILTTVSKQLSDDVQELLLKAGYCFRETIRDRRGHFGGYDPRSDDKRPIITKHIQYDINWLQLPDIEIDMSKAKKTKSFQEEWIDYSGCVYCVTVPNHIIYIRRNGKGIWCGNSARNYTSGTSQKAHDIIRKYEALSENICYFCGRPDVHMTDAGWVLPMCKKCYEKHWRRGSKYEYADVICDEDSRMADIYHVKRFSKDGDEIITYDYSDTTNKIRIWWNKHHPDDQVELYVSKSEETEENSGVADN